MARVLHYLDTDTFAGTEQHILTLLPTLKAQGVDCGLVLCEDNEQFVQKASTLEGITVFIEPSLPIRRAVPQFLNRVREWKPDLVHAHNGRTMLACAWVYSRTGGQVKSVATQHFVDPAHTGYRGGKKVVSEMLHRWTNRHLTRIVAISDAVRESAISREHLSPSQIVTVRNGIEKPTANPESARAVVRSLGVSDSSPLLVTTARLSDEKGHRFLMDAAPKVLARFPEARFLWLGTGDQEADLKAEVERRGLQKEIYFLGFRTDAPDFVALADLLILPSLCEPFGLAVVEGMMLETPVIATDCGGPPEILFPSHPKASPKTAAGALVPPSDGNALASVIVDLLENPELRQQIGHNGKKRAEAEFTAERMGQEMAALYRKCLE